MVRQDQQPSRGYFIAGTWTKWRAIKMENEGGPIRQTCTFGRFCCARFRIILQGRAARKRVTRRLKQAEIRCARC